MTALRPRDTFRRISYSRPLWRGPPPAGAQELQAGKPIRLIVGLSAGGGTDVTARLWPADGADMGTSVMVENKAGGNFIPAAGGPRPRPTAIRCISSRRVR